MPPHILPKSLFCITLKTVEGLVNTACINIEERYGNYDSNKCQQAVQCVQQYLLSNIPGLVLDEVCEERNNNVGLHCSRVHDGRISLAVYMHNNMRTFTVGETKHNVCVDDNFWISHLSRLHNLIALDLHLMCTDEILEVVGNTCIKLEDINIVSRLAPEQVKINARCETFNALKLRFFISDKGLSYLSNCKYLKKITMNKMLRSNFGGRMMTDAGIRKLVKSLPNIQAISYDDMGVILSEDMDDVESIPLQYLSDHHPASSHIKAASRLCKNLQHLCLHLPNLAYDQRLKASEILDVLTSSDLNVQTLELYQFPCSPEFFALLKVKGNSLITLILQTNSPICATSVRFIGENCPNLKSLQLKEVVASPQQDYEQCERQYSFNSEPLFCNLRCLYVWGSKWNPDVILPLCLTHAKEMEYLTLLKANDYRFLDEVMAKVLRNNPLTNLKSIQMFTGCLVSLTTLRYFIKYCPDLAELSFTKHSDIKNKDIKEIYDEIRLNNLDLRVCSVEGGDR
ncbi:hypothetical protein R5R35_007592 [Gryllus longicercus]|uniref:Uncharacterized protein n=1 Tax=Gryllus longicercus TaxID=2509291 RepID=A0AAN9ZDS6_9ORTH